MGLQPRTHGVAASNTWGCSLSVQCGLPLPQLAAFCLCHTSRSASWPALPRRRAPPTKSTCQQHAHRDANSVGLRGCSAPIACVRPEAHAG